LNVYSAADLVITVTQEDTTALRESGVRSHLVQVPNFAEVPEVTFDKKYPNRIIFIGGFNHKPNVDAIEWFVREILPILRNKWPAVELLVVGSNAPENVARLSSVPNVKFLGHQNDVSGLLGTSSVSIAPLRYGAGMKGKVTQALSWGLPVVTTTIGAQGLGAVHEKHLRLADSKEDFASEVYECLANPSRAAEMGKAGRSLIANLCGEKSIIERLEKELRLETSSIGATSRRKYTIHPRLVGLVTIWQLKKIGKVVGKACKYIFKCSVSCLPPFRSRRNRMEPSDALS